MNIAHVGTTVCFLVEGEGARQGDPCARTSDPKHDAPDRPRSQIHVSP